MMSQNKLLHENHIIEEFESEDPLMWADDLDQPMWSDLDAQMWETQYEITKDGMLILPVPLAEGDTLQVKGTFYYRCRFADDEQQYTNFMSNLWKANKIEMIGSLGNKV